MVDGVAVVLGVVAVSALVHAVTGFGFAFVAVPPLTLFLGPAETVLIVTATGLPVTALCVYWDRRFIARDEFRAVTLFALLGFPVGLLVLLFVPAGPLELALCGVAVVSAVVIASGVTWSASRGGIRLAGVSSGALLTSSGMNGLPLILLFRGLEFEQRHLRGTTAASLLVQGTLGVPLMGLASAGWRLDTAVVLSLGIPAALGGWLVGELLSRRSSTQSTRNVTVTVLALPAVLRVALEFQPRGSLW